MAGPRAITREDIVLIGEAGGYDIPGANVWTRPAPPIYGIDESENVKLLRAAQSWRDMRVKDIDERNMKASRLKEFRIDASTLLRELTSEDAGSL